MMKSPEFSFGQPPKPETETFDSKQALHKSLRQLYKHALQSQEGIDGLRHWRSFAKKSKGSREAVSLFETLSAYNHTSWTNPERKDALAASLSNSITFEPGKLTRAEEFLACCQAKELGQPVPDARPEVKGVFKAMLSSKSSEGEVDVPELMASNHFSFGSKAKWFDSRLGPAIDFLEKLDLNDARREAEQPVPPEIMEQKQEHPETNVPPPRDDELAPSMDEMTPSQENEPGAYFKIAPFYGGYYRGNDYDVWNPKAMKWEKSASALTPVMQKELETKSRRVMSGTIRPGQPAELPMPYGFAPDVASLKAAGGAHLIIKQDGHGGFTIEAPSASDLVTFSVEIGRTDEHPRENEPAEISTKRSGLKFGDDTEKACKEIARSASSIMDKARALKAYVRKTLTYSNDSRYNQVYRSGSGSDYFKRIEEHKQADCDVANTYFVALLWSQNIKARLVSGHYVSSKDKHNAAVISSGTGHAWAEAWDGSAWQRLDATPPGDPNMDEEETDEEASDEAFEGDFGERESQPISDEELEKLMDEATKALENKTQDAEEQRALQFSEQAGCSVEEAKQVMRRIAEAREKRDRQGRLIRSRLLQEWQKIIQDNFLRKPSYTGQIRLSRGEELDDPVETVLDIKAGEADPTGFSRHEHKIEREQVYGGFDSFLVVDKSSSMEDSDGTSGRPKWQDQQVFTFLLMDSMYAASEEFKRAKIKLISPLDLRVALVSFSAGGAKVELPLGTTWGPKEQVRVWKALQENVGGGTPDHLGLQAVKKLIEQDDKENGSGKERLRLVLVSADGGSDDVSKTISAKEKLKSMGAVVKAAGIGSGARAVISTYTPDGSNLNSFSDAPDWAAKEVLDQARRLYPRKIQK